MGKDWVGIINYLTKCQNECLWQTGRLMNSADIEGHLECDEFVSKFGNVEFSELFQYLILG